MHINLVIIPKGSGGGCMGPKYLSGIWYMSANTGLLVDQVLWLHMLQYVLPGGGMVGNLTMEPLRMLLKPSVFIFPITVHIFNDRDHGPPQGKFRNYRNRP